MRKRLSLSLVLVFGLVGCNSYGSLYEAREACAEWEEKEKTVELKRRYKVQRTIGSRYCLIEEETNQVLGFMNKTIENGNWKINDNEGEDEVVKRFKY